MLHTVAVQTSKRMRLRYRNLIPTRVGDLPLLSSDGGYRARAPINQESIRTTKFHPPLREPIGVEPDFALVILAYRRRSKT